MRATETPSSSGVVAALVAAVLFGASTPLAKALLADLDPLLLAGLLYLGAGLGLFAWRRARRLPRMRVRRGDSPWLAGSVVCGGVVAPVLLLVGLSGMAATGASLLLNSEAVFTVLIAWFAFRENVSARVVLGMLAIVAGAVALSWPQPGGGPTPWWPASAVVGACLLWGLDNNLTRRISHLDATGVAMVKGLVAGVVNTALAVVFHGPGAPSGGQIAAVLVVGLLGYGASLALVVFAMRNLGTARTGAYFSVAPFFGAAVAVALLGEPVTIRLLLAGVLMALGVWLHLTERHGHPHSHEPVEHSHPIEPGDAHHEDVAVDPADPRLHRHGETTHAHPHYPDLHHRHGHG